MTARKVSLSSSDTNRDPLVGRQLGDYRLTDVLATGGMSRIYLGTDTRLQRHAAVKVLTQDDVETDRSLMQRFQREARAIAALEHDNIITIYQYGEQDGLYFLAMKLVRGHDLAKELKQLKAGGKRMDIARALSILRQVASALDYAHAAGVIHRDVKPSNILLQEDGKAVLTDFGLVMRPSVESTMGTAFGTPRYIAPEQAISSSKAGPQSDIYSLGVILYEILTGQTPFDGDTPMAIALSHIGEAPPPPRSKNKQIPEAVEAEILKALEKEPEQRHQLATDFINAVSAGYGLVVAPDAPLVRGAVAATGTMPAIEGGVLDRSTTPGSLTPILGETRVRRLPLGLLAGLGVLIAVAGAAVVLLIAASRGGAAPGAAITLSYTDSNFTMVNGGSYALEVAALAFVRGTADGQDDYSGDRVSGDRLPAGACFRISLQGRQDAPPAACKQIQSAEFLNNPLRLFWRTETEAGGVASTFSVEYEGTLLARCATVGRGGNAECRFNWPVPPPAPAS